MESAAPVVVPVTGERARTPATWMAPLVVVLFFAWGFATVLVDSLIPKLKGLFALSYTEVMLTQFCFFLAYFVVSVPAGLLLGRIGYLRGLVLGLAIMAGGCLLFAPAARWGVYPGFLLALFIMASGITILQVAANPLMATLGDSSRSHFRLTLAQAFNSLGTTVGPIFGAALILAGGVDGPDPQQAGGAMLEAYRRSEAAALQMPFLGIAAVLALLALVFWALRDLAGAPRANSTRVSLVLLRRPRVALGVLAIFLYVGAEVSIGSVMVSYLMQGETLRLDAQRAGQLVSLYWGGAMVGRFIGSVVLRRVAAGSVLCGCALMACLLALASAGSSGVIAGATIIAIGLFNSVMFPTIFTLSIEGLGDDTPQASGLLCMAIVGGAVIPLLTGALADRFGLGLALVAPALCYLYIAGFGWHARRPGMPA